MSEKREAAKRASPLAEKILQGMPGAGAGARPCHQSSLVSTTGPRFLNRREKEKTEKNQQESQQEVMGGLVSLTWAVP